MTRTDPPHHGSERDTLSIFLECQRTMVVAKAQSLRHPDEAKRMRRSGGSFT